MFRYTCLDICLCRQIHVSRYTCLMTVYIHLSRYMCLHTRVQIHMSRYTCLDTCVHIHVSRYTCLDTDLQISYILVTGGQVSRYTCLETDLYISYILVTGGQVSRYTAPCPQSLPLQHFTTPGRPKLSFTQAEASSQNVQNINKIILLLHYLHLKAGREDHP